MKTTKRILAVLLSVLLVSVLLAGCGQQSAAGKYIVKTIGGKTVEESFKSELGDLAQTFTTEDLLEMMGLKSFDDFMTLELKEDGTATMVVAMEDETSTGTWKQDGTKVTITFDGDPAEFTMNGDELSSKIDGEDYVFVKK